MKLAEPDIYVTPSTFGAVISLKRDNGLHRFFLNEKTTKALLDLIEGKHTEATWKLEMSLASKEIDIEVFVSRVKELDFVSRWKAVQSLMTEHKWVLWCETPLQISYEITRYCVARCFFCYNSSARRSHDFASLATVKPVRDYAAEFGVKFGFSGGEPTLHPEFYKMLSYRSEEIYDTIITSLVGNADLDKLGKLADVVQVSLHGPPQVHDKILGIPGQYQKSLEALYILGKQTRVGTNSVLSDQTLETLPRLVEALDMLYQTIGDNLEYVRFVLALPSGRGVHQVNLSRELGLRFRDMMDQIQSQFKLPFMLPSQYRNPLFYGISGERMFCPAGTTECEISFNGRVRPCNQFPDAAASKENILNRPFKDIWYNYFSDFRGGLDLNENVDAYTKYFGCRFLHYGAQKVTPKPQGCGATMADVAVR